MKIVSARMGRAAALAAALLLSAGCATKRDLRDLRVELRALSARQDSILAALARQNRVTQDTLRQQTNQLFEIRGDVSRQLQRILDDLSTLTELTGQNQRAIASIRDQLEGLRMRGPEPEPGAGEAIVAGQPTGGSDPSELYDVAFRQYQSNNIGAAQAAFRDFVQQYPSHDLTPKARFYLADILEQQEKVDEALAAFEEIAELHPTSDTVPDALYGAGMLQVEKGNRAEARRLFQRVVNTYPESNAAGPARQELDKLR